jgi:hypothetical protein
MAVQKGLIRALESSDGQIGSAHTNMVAEMIRAMSTYEHLDIFQF